MSIIFLPEGQVASENKAFVSIAEHLTKLMDGGTELSEIGPAMVLACAGLAKSCGIPRSYLVEQLKDVYDACTVRTVKAESA